MLDRAFKVAVLGSASIPGDSFEGRQAHRVGQLIATEGCILLTGGCTGLPHAAVSGAASAGGLTVAISPAKNRKEHEVVYRYPLDSLVILFTGMGRKGRNVVLIRSADACIFLRGGMGTLNEFTIAFTDLGSTSAIGVLAGAGGLTDEIPTLVSLEPRTPRSRLIVDSDPESLLSKILLHLRDRP
jgi:uncharacterized protein (TIGR00725 family)